MKFSYNWISELVEGVDVSPKDLGQMITLKTAECEGVEPYGAFLAETCMARVLRAEAIPDSKNKKVLVDTGRYGERTVVCGAPNCRAGMVSAYVPAGVKLGDGKEIGKAEIRGVVSDGMLASGAELGINGDGAGILELEGEPGEAIPGCAPDWVLEIDNKSLTHRPDLWGHHGMAREVAAIVGKPLKDPVDLGLLPKGDADIEVEIEDYELCPRYSALTFENASIHPSSPWMQYRLQTIGLNAINNMVDVTNYVLSEIAQPMHAFDRDTLTGNKIIARRGRPGEFVTALNEETYNAGPADCLIGDAKGAVAIGGIMGGLDTRVMDSTQRIVLESANFQAASIRKTSSRMKLRTDASIRFEKAQDPANTVRGLARAVELFAATSPGIRLVGGVADAKKELPPPPQIALHLEWLARKLGREVALADVKRILESLEFGVEEIGGKTVAVTVPSWRATRDVSIKDDLVEEVGRMVGYDSVPVEAPLIPSTVSPANGERAFYQRIREVVSNQGFNEVYNYSFVNEEMAEEFGFDPGSHVRVINPIASDQSLLRTSLAPGILKNIRQNSKNFSEFRLFEIGREIHRNEVEQELPHEVDHLMAAVYAREGDGEEGLFEAKRLAECLLPGCKLRLGEAMDYEHPSRVYSVWWREEPVGRISELHPKMVEGRVALLDVNLATLARLGPVETKYRPLPKYPSSAFDLSVIAGQRELSGEIQEKLAGLAGESLASIEFVRRYEGAPLPAGMQSLSYRLTVLAPGQTLKTDEVAAIRQRIIDGMEAAGYQLRV